MFFPRYTENQTQENGQVSIKLDGKMIVAKLLSCVQLNGQNFAILTVANLPEPRLVARHYKLDEYECALVPPINDSDLEAMVIEAYLTKLAA